jgi:hypothetical protein
VVTNKKTIVTDGTQTPAFQPVVFDGILVSWVASVKSSLCLCSLLADSGDDKPQCSDTNLLFRYMLVCYGLNNLGFDTRKELGMFSAPERRDRFWGRRILLFIGYQSSSPRVNRPEHDVDHLPHLILSRSRMRWAIPLRPMAGVDRGILGFFFFCLYCTDLILNLPLLHCYAERGLLVLRARNVCRDRLLSGVKLTALNSWFWKLLLQVAWRGASGRQTRRWQR